MLPPRKPDGGRSSEDGFGESQVDLLPINGAVKAAIDVGKRFPRPCRPPSRGAGAPSSFCKTALPSCRPRHFLCVGVAMLGRLLVDQRLAGMVLLLRD